MKQTTERTRALILAQAASPEDAAQNLYRELADEGGDNFVVVRAEVVDYVYNLVVFVDTASPDWLREVHHMIRRITRADHTLVIPVVQHVPFPPHDAQGYITEEEVKAGKAEGIEPGRQHHSPGENAWG